jgi:hypothetical protein
VSAAEQNTFVFPPALVTRADLARLVREIEDIDNDLEAQKARNHASGQTGYRLPSMSRPLADFMELNKIDATNDQARMHLKEQMRVLKDKAPIMHMTFATEADPKSLQQLMAYLRQEIHPQTLLSVGLQPSLVGGAYVRTPNHVHDFSLRARMAQQRGLIMQELEALKNAIPVVEAPAEPAAPAQAQTQPAATAAVQPAAPATQPPEAAK